MQLCLALCYFSTNCFSVRLFAKKFACNRRFWKTPYQCEHQPVWNTHDASDGKPELYICWSKAAGAFQTMWAKTWLARSMDAKTIMFGFDKVCLPDGYVSIPAMNPSYGNSGTSKFRRVSCKLVDQYASIKKGKALAAASSKAPGPKYAKFPLPRGSVALKGHLKRSTGSVKPPEPPGPPPAKTDASSCAKAQPPMPPQQKNVSDMVG